MIDRHPAGWGLVKVESWRIQLKRSTILTPTGKRATFSPAYVYLKYIDHFIHHALA